MRGEVQITPFCDCCGAPSCPYCGCCTTPVWAVPLMFQCDCGYSGLADVSRMPAAVAEAFHALWRGVERRSGAGGLG